MPSGKQKKDKKAPRQTLHDFFGPKSLSGAQPKPVPNTSTSARSRPSQEVIIIDSDSDDAVEFVEPIAVKRRKLSLKNIDTPPSTTAIVMNTAVRSKENASAFLGQHASRNSSDIVAPKPEETFGRPFLLVSDPVEDISPNFGKPFLLLQPESSTVLPDETVASGSKASHSSLLYDSPVDIDLTLDDWENGDDEDVQGTIPEDDELNLVEPRELVDHVSSRTGSLPQDDDFFDSLIRMSTEDDSPAAVSHLEAKPSLSDLRPGSCSNSLAALGAGDKSKTAGNAFAFLMSSFKENEVWKEATIAQDKKSRHQKSNGGRRKAPFYKVLQGMPIAVDAFQYGEIPGITAFFLTHAHSDHYTNLSSNWRNGPIYCSEGTANLIMHMLRVDRKWVHPLPMDTPTVIPNTNGVTVTLIEANHCPGSCLFFFEGRQTVNAGDSTFKSSFVGSSKIFRYLHCGDFRASPRHLLHPAVKDKVVDHVYLDTTYLDPKYTFPPQSLVISACAELAKRVVDGQSTKETKSTVLSWMTSLASSDIKGKAKEKSKFLVVIGTYSIGKERIAKAIANALRSKIYCDARKTAILRCQGDQELDSLLTSDPMEGFVHLVPLSTITTDHLKIYLDRFGGRYDRLIGFRPTGWTYTPAAGSNQVPTIPSILSSHSTQTFTFADLEMSRQSTLTLQLYPVPYSEHSSFYELTCFAMSFNWVEMIATVNVGSEVSRANMSKWIAKWQAERKKRGQDTIVPYRHPNYW